ncbi:hypothetical protein ZIOFF_035218 [Zingiber officinale]|uniref:Pre-mRNA-splicing factor 3 domain-containing protein n=1 Tax=Zingiber officinale TaxID=94328 RepID=A0A8J5L0I0_ZINOF|nr:hypothetical protein ZIOFF_035218 [Zingiber officinale]
MTQEQYAKEVLKRFRIDDCNPINTPVDYGTKLSKSDEGKTVDPTHFKSLVGSLRDKPLLPGTTYDDYVELKLNTEKITIYGKLRKSESSSEREGWAGDSKQGLLEPPKPKVKENNLMKVLGFEAAQDPTKVCKLTPAKRREKKEKQLFDGPSSLETFVSIYKSKDLSH